MLDLIAKPERVVPGFSASRWNAAFNPVVFTFRRRDITVTGAAANAQGKLIAYLNATPTGVRVGQYVYIEAAPYVGSFKVLSVAGTTVTLDTSFTVNATGHLNSDAYRTGHQVEVRVLYVVGTQWQVYSVKYASCDPTGIARIDVSKRIQPLLKFINAHTYTGVNTTDASAGGKFNIQYREVWLSNLNPAWSSFTNAMTHYFVRAVKQIQQQYGSVMGEHSTFFPAAQDCNARFLVPAAEVSYWPGFPFDLSFIYSEKIAPYDVSRKQNNLDLNKQLIGSTTTTLLDGSQHTSVNRLMLDTVPATAEYVDVWLHADSNASPADLSYMEPGYVATGYALEMERGNELEPNPTE
jgi:hypothetical protein